MRAAISSTSISCCVRCVGFGVVKGHRAKDITAARSGDRNRPARHNPGDCGRFAQVFPERVLTDVLDDNRHVPVRSGSAGAYRRSDAQPFDGSVVVGRQARAGTNGDVFVLWVDEQDRTSSARRSSPQRCAPSPPASPRASYAERGHRSRPLWSRRRTHLRASRALQRSRYFSSPSTRETSTRLAWFYAALAGSRLRRSALAPWFSCRRDESNPGTAARRALRS